MEAVSLENISAMKCSVVIHKEDISWFHGECCDALLASSLDFLAIFQTQRVHCVCVEYLSHTNLWHSTRTAITQLASVIVGIVEPDRNTRNRVSVDGGFRTFHSLIEKIMSV
jgi:hypothetical protein